MKIRYAEFDPHKGNIFRQGYTEKMKRCYENYNKKTGEFDNYNHCGSSVKHDIGYYVCPNGGNLMKICGYMGMCGAIYKPKELEDKQLSFFEE